MADSPLDYWMEHILKRTSQHTRRRFRRRYERDVVIEWVRESEEVSTPCLRATDTGTGVVLHEGIDEATVAGLFVATYLPGVGTASPFAAQWAARGWAKFVGTLDEHLAFLARMVEAEKEISSGESGDGAPASSEGNADTIPEASAGA